MVNGRRLIVAFSDHAMARASERRCPGWPSYAALGDSFAFFDQCLEFEPCILHGGHFAFTFWETASPGFKKHSLAQYVLGESDDEAEYSFRVGYCPAVIEGDYFKAKTLLFPGYAGTPEYGLIVGSGLPGARRSELVSLTKRLDAEQCLTDEGAALMKWFQDRVRHVVPKGRGQICCPLTCRTIPAETSIYPLRPKAGAVFFCPRPHLAPVADVSGRPNTTTEGRFITSHFEETRIRRLDSEAHPERSEAEYGESAQNGPHRDHHYVAAARLVAAADRPRAGR